MIPDVPPELSSICDKALRRNPGRRYASAQALADEVEAYQSGARVAAYDYSSLELLRRFVSRNRALTGVSVLVVAVLVRPQRMRPAKGRSDKRMPARLSAYPLPSVAPSQPITPRRERCPQAG